MSKKSETPTIRRISWLVWGMMAVLMIMLISAFAHALTLNATLREKVATLEPLLEQQQDLNATLQAQLEYVQSDAYIEAWAQEQAGMARPGETLVVPLAATMTPTPTPLPELTPSTPPASQPFWVQWWQALFGE
ncbi:MAG: septum formation initiator family protein [Anaerolineae bacterium]|jgi:cell division protein FtsB|nr:septum formation initiator family protein [Anaerolineae bacterium]